MIESQRKKNVGPHVAVLMATYNGEQYLKEQFDSLIEQTYKNFECYIHDDGSIDKTIDIISEYVKWYPNLFIYIPGNSCGGSKNNFLFLLRQVQADYYMFCDQDDIWSYTKIQDSLNYMMNVNQAGPICIYTDLKVVNEKLDILNDSFYAYTSLAPMKNTYKQLIMSNVCVGCSMLFNRALRDIAIDFYSDNIMMHDWQIALIASLLGQLRYFHRATVMYRQHARNVLGASKEANVIQKIKRISNLMAYIKRKRFYKERPRYIARDLLLLPGITSQQRNFLNCLANIEKESKLKRISFYHKNKLYRQRINKFWQLIQV